MSEFLTFFKHKTSVSSRENFVQSVKLAFPGLTSLNGEALAFYELASAVGSGNRASIPASNQLTSLPTAADDVHQEEENNDPISGAATAGVPEVYDCDAFIKKTTEPLEKLLLECQQTLERETKAFLQSFS